MRDVRQRYKQPIDTHAKVWVNEITTRKDTFNNRTIWETFSVLKKRRTGSDEISLNFMEKENLKKK